MNADIEQVFIFVDQPDGLLFLAIVDDLFQPVKPPYTVINVGYEIARAKVVQVFQRQRLLGGIPLAEMEFMIAFKYLVVGVAGNFQVFVEKAFVQGEVEGGAMSTSSLKKARNIWRFGLMVRLTRMK